ncbi:MAG TPA: SDR family NAD(P)-dependent oxidoreductase [Caulobacteraceae bacterium]|nr:SDR family NAD(P)-dependent oxidoreductase [Caulobacteraceae bacterium]
MPGRLADKTAVVVGAGQTPGSTIGNGRATAILFAREGARVACVDRVRASAEETVAAISAEGGQALAFEADISREADCEALIADAGARLGRIDILHNNVGIGGGDGPAHRLERASWERILSVNLEGMWLTIKHALPVMRAQGGGAIVNISSLASIAPANMLAYEVSKAGVNKLTTSVAAANARHGVRCNAILPGLMDTPMAVEGIAQASGRSVNEVRAARDARVPLGGRMGTAWDVAYAALFLASDEAKFITGVLLPVDGGMSVRVG